jgi:DNA-binding beta-propeller fold protein YncE
MAAVAVGVALSAFVLPAAPARADDPIFARAFGAGPADLCTTNCRAGSNGNAAGQLSFPYAVAVSSDEVFVADQANQRISVYSTDGTFLRAFGKNVNLGGGNPDLCSTATTCRAGSNGGAAGQLSSPYAVAIEGGEVFVADSSNNRVSVFSTGGVFSRAFGKSVNAGPGNPDVCTASTTCRAGSSGAAAGQLSFPLGIAVSGGEVYVSDSSNSRVSVFAVDGAFARTFGTAGSGAGQLSFPFGIGVGGGSVYVADRNNQRISEFATDGTFVKAFGKNVNAGLGSPDVCTTLTTCKAGTIGGAAGQLRNPLGVAVAGGEVYVADGNHRVNVFAADGTFARGFGTSVNSGAGSPNLCTTATGCQIGSPGGAAAQLNLPYGTAVAGGEVYVADQTNNRVTVYGTDGVFARAFGKNVNAGAGNPDVCTLATTCRTGTAGSAAGQLALPSAVAVSGGEVYVADQNNQRISVFATDGTFARAFGKGVNAAVGGGDVCTAATTCKSGTLGGAASQLDNPVAVAVGGGEVYVTDQGNRRVSVFATGGTFARAFGKAVNLGAGSPDICTAASTCRFGSQGGAAGQLNSPFGIALDGGEVYVADYLNNRISVFATDGTFSRAFGKSVNAGTGSPDVCTAATTCRTGGQGGAAGQISFPFGVGVGAGAIYVSERFNARISVLGPDGVFARAFGKGVNSGAGNPDVCTTTCRAAAQGDAAGQFTEPLGLAVSGTDIYIADRLQHRITMFRVPRTEISSDPVSLAYGSRDIDDGPTAAQSSTVTNTGTETVTVTGLTLTGDVTQFERLTGAAGDCAVATVLTPGQTCTVRARFDPTTVGGKGATLTIASNAPSITVGLTGTGIQTQLSATPPSLVFGARDVDDGPSAAQSSTIANAGTQAVSLNALTLGGDGAHFERLTGVAADCTTTTVLLPGQTCTLRVRFNPATGGAKASTLTVGSNAPSLGVQLTGTGIQTQISATPPAQAFGARDIDDGPAPTQSTTIANSGTETVTLATLTLSGATTQFERLTGAPGDCAAAMVLQAGQSCTVRLRFDPTSTGAKAASLAIASNAPTVTLALSGSGIQTQLGASPGTLAFGGRDVDDGPAATRSTTISNIGSETVSLTGLTLSGDATEFEHLTGALGDCTATTVLQSGETCTMRFAFDPTSTGDKSAAFTIVSNAPPIAVGLTGRGVHIELSHGPTSLTFGERDVNTGASSDQTATITNTGTDTVNLTGLSFAGEGAHFVRVTGAGDDCTTANALVAGETCNLRLRFDPSSIGAKAASLVVTSNAAPVAVGLTGSGILTEVSPSPGALAFGARDLDEGGTVQASTIANTGTEPVTLSGLTLSGDSAHFARLTGEAGDCTATTALGVGATCRVRLRFDPTTTGAKTATLTVASNAPAATVGLSGTGTSGRPDTDGDGIPDDEDTDDDNDGVPDDQDAFPLDPTRQIGGTPPPTIVTPPPPPPAPVQPAQAPPRRWRLKKVGRVRVVRRGDVVRVVTGYAAICPAGTSPCAGRFTLKQRRRSPRTGKLIPIFLTAKSRVMTIAPGKRRRISLRLSERGHALLARAGTITAVLRGSMRRDERPPVARRAKLRLVR